MISIVRLLNNLTLFASAIGGIGVIAMLVHITADIILRSVLSIAIPVTHEMVTNYYMVMLALLPLGWVEKSYGMIKVEAFPGIFGERGVRALDTLVATLSVGIYAILTFVTANKAIESFQRGDFVVAVDTKIALWPSYFVPPVSFGLAALICLGHVLVALLGTSFLQKIKTR